MKEMLTARRGKKTQTHTFTWLQHNDEASIWPWKSQGEGPVLLSSMGATSEVGETEPKPGARDFPDWPWKFVLIFRFSENVQ